MGIKSLFGFGQARDKPVDKAADAGYSFLFGRTTSGKPVNERTAMQTTAVYACVRILAEAVASLPLHVYEYHPARCGSTATHRAARSGSMTIRCTICSMMSRTQR